jgi:methyl-accepting chemotaxis protein
MLTKQQSIIRQLAYGFGVVMLLLFAAGAWNTREATRVARNAEDLRRQVSGQTKPATDILEAAQEVAIATGYYTRTQTKNELEAARAQFAVLIRALRPLNVAAHADPADDGAKKFIKTLIPLIRTWSKTFDEVGKEIEISNRSVRGLGAQASLLISVFTQQAAGAIEYPPGVNAAAARQMFQTSVFKLGEMQNAVLFTYAAQDPVFAEKAAPTLAAFRAEFEKVRATIPPGDTKDLFDELSGSIKDFADELSDLPKSYRRRIEKLRELDLAGHAVIAAITPVLDRGMETTLAASIDNTARADRLVAGLGLLALLVPALGILIGFFIGRNVIRSLTDVIVRLRSGSAKTTELARLVATASRSLADGANTQAASLEESGASLEELSSMTRRNAESAAAGRASAGQALAATQACAAHMERMKTVMNSIQASSAEITKINRQIDEVAFLTNILALNAAIEAARAGAAGAGFAVVAEEVRALAGRSAEAARETAEKVADASRRSDQGAEACRSVAAGLEEILARANDVNGLVAEIATASSEQSMGIEQVTSSITQIDKVTQNNAAEADHTAASSAAFDAETEKLAAVIDDLQSLIGGSSRAGRGADVTSDLSPSAAGRSALASASA